MQQNSCFLYHTITSQQIKISYITPSITCLPTLRALLSPPTVCFLIVKQFLVWVGDLSLPCAASGRMHAGADTFVVQQDTPPAPDQHSISQLILLYSILVSLLLNQPWRVVSGVMVWEKGTHVWSEAHVSVGAHVVNDSLGNKRSPLH